MADHPFNAGENLRLCRITWSAHSDSALCDLLIVQGTGQMFKSGCCFSVMELRERKR